MDTSTLFAHVWDASAPPLDADDEFFRATPGRYVPLYPAIPDRLPRPEQALYVRLLPCLASAPQPWRITINGTHTIVLPCPREAVAAALDALAPALAPWTADDTDDGRAGPEDPSSTSEGWSILATSFYTRVHRRPPAWNERAALAAHVRSADSPDGVFDVTHVCEWTLPPAPAASFVWSAMHLPWDPAPLYDAFGPALPAELLPSACPSCRAAPRARWTDPTTQTEFCPGFVELRERASDHGVVAFYRPCGAAALAPPMSELAALAAYQGNSAGDAESAPTHTASGNRIGAGPTPYDSATYVLGRWSGSTYNLRAEAQTMAHGDAPRAVSSGRIVDVSCFADRGSSSVPKERICEAARGARVGRHVVSAPFVSAFLHHVVYYIERYGAEPTPQLVRDLLRAQRHWEHTRASSRVSATLKRVPTDIAPLLAAAAGLPPRRFAPLPREIVYLHGRLSTLMTVHRRRACAGQRHGAKTTRGAAGGRPHAATTLAYAHALVWMHPPRDTPLSTPRYGKSDRPCRESRARVKATLDAAARALLHGTPYADMPLPVYEPFPVVAMGVFSPAPGSRPIDVDQLE